jgi:signal peptidase I
MIPTILIGDRVFVLKCAYQIRVPFTRIRLYELPGPKRGDVVILRNPDGDRVPLVKRVVGLPGEIVELRQERLYVNGALQPAELARRGLDESGEAVLVGNERLGLRKHLFQVLPGRPALRTFGPVRVPPGDVFLMGDNRDDSRDSRYFGPRPVSDLIGKAEGIFWSWNAGILKGPRLSRFFRSLHTES